MVVTSLQHSGGPAPTRAPWTPPCVRRIDAIEAQGPGFSTSKDGFTTFS